ncbi:WG repeat-containing protein [Pedobacter nototheniae]|uniref:WG repeat-containing protein n=1 Tax=Pedobacter nototheniae TaxID=2488994 RepID=UPI002931064E|nr:WG repeat-containing protein [Pedobacter nototheniae]
MRTICFFLIILGAVFLLSCNRQKDGQNLYYFPNTDTTYVGVKNGRGDIIIPAVHPILSSRDINDFYDGLETTKRKPRIFYSTEPKLIPDNRYDFEKPITGIIIEFAGISKGSEAAIEKPCIPGGEVYNREGKFLYYVAGYITHRTEKGFSFISPEPFSEGYRPYVEKGKLGFVDGLGNKVTPARWDFSGPFNSGYARVYGGGWKQLPMPGYIDYKPLTDTAFTGYINIKGELIKTAPAAKSDKDYSISNRQYLANPFIYTKKEQQLVDSLNKIKAITHTNSIDIIRTESEGKSIHFEITDRPKNGFPYYYIQGYWENLGDAMYTFLVQQDTKEIFHYSAPFFLADEKIPLDQWITDGLQKVKNNWETEAPGTKLKVNIDKELKHWQSIAKENNK